MPRSGKKKRQAAAAAAAAASTSISVEPSSETSQQQASQQEQKEQEPPLPRSSKQKHQKAAKDPQLQSKQQVILDPQKQQSQQPQSQPQQQQAALGQPQQQQAALRQSQQQQASLRQPQQQPGAWGQPQQQQAALGQPQQQQAALRQPQQQPGAWGQPQQQQAALGQPQQQQAALRQPQQQQAALGQPQQQQAALRQPQQQQAALGQPQQQPGAWGQPQQQQAASGQPQQQPGAWVQPQQQHAALGQPQQQPGAWGQPQQQQAAFGQPQQQPGAWVQPQQQHAALGQPQQQPGAWGQPQHQQAALGQSHQQQAALRQPQQQQAALRQPQQQQAALGQPQQQPGAWGQPQQQQAAFGQPQQQPGAWVQPQQHAALGQPQQQPGAWGQPQHQQAALGQSHQQQAALRQPQQQQAALRQPQQQQAALRQPQQQQAALGQPQQQQAAWGQPQQQQAALGQPQQQPGAWGQPQQQQAALRQPQQQQQAALGQPQQQRGGPPVRGKPQQQQLGAWGQTPQQQAALGQPQQIPQSQPQYQQTQQQQKASIDIGAAAGDSRQQPHGDSRHRQQPSSTKSLDVSELGVTDPFYSETTEKAKISSTQMAMYQKMIPKRARPDQGGTMGLKTQVFTNLFKIIFDNKFVTTASHYDVTIKPSRQSNKSEDKKEPKLPKALCREIFEECRKKYFKNRYPAYDGKKNAYSGNDLPFNDICCDVFEHENSNGRMSQYEIIMKKVATIDLSWIKNYQPGFAANRDQTAVQVLDIILRHAPESRFLNIGRSLFWDPTMDEKLASGVVLGTGGFMSGILGWKPYLNVDVSHKGFTIKQRVLEYIAEVVNVREDRLTFEDVMGRNISKMQNFLRGLKVSYEIPNGLKRTHRIIKLSEKTCETTFTQEINNRIQTVSIQQYFLNTKRYKIRKPQLPTLHVSTKSDGSEILLPIELCTIVPNQPLRKLDEYSTANMIKRTATDAFTRKQRIENAFKKIDVNNSPVMTKEFRLSVSQTMEKVPARILAAPELSYARENARVNQGKWEMKQFNQAKHLETNTWTIVNLSGRPINEDALRTFTNHLIETGPSVGMKIQNPATPYRFYRCTQYREIESFFKDNIKLKLIIVIVPNQTDEMYGKVKKITEMEVGVLTQCIKGRTLEKLASQNAFQARSTLKNILLKINSKLNGVNHIFSKMPSCISEQYPCMLVGADVTHPSPDSKDVPSIAAVAASRDKSAFRYNIALRLQQPKEEMIVDLRNIILSHLQMYLKETKCVPKRIIYYRDGVSEGQLPQIMYYEIEAIKKAISDFSRDKKIDIEITCLVVQKRHHVRLFPTSSDNCSDLRTKNVQVGTIVDTTITHPDHIDFYLVSHASIQGTARPTKYRCIYNQSNFTEDQLEQLTFYLCHIYARCTRSVSYPAPTYYAHLAAYRGRALMQGYRDFKLCNIDREQRNFINFTILKMGESPMFFV